MRSTANGKLTTASANSVNCATLSVVVVSSGSAAVAKRAAQVLASRCPDFSAQLIVVSQDNDHTLATSLERWGAVHVPAPRGSTRAEMCDLGMNYACGTIVAVRDDVAVGDAAWLDTYRTVVPVQVPAIVAGESVVMDTLVAGQAALADSPTGRAPLAGTASIEMVAAI